MNRQSPPATASNACMVSASDLAAWDAKTFSQNARLARHPLALTGGFGQQRITLVSSSPAPIEPAVTVPMHLDDNILQLCLHGPALDQLVGVLEPGFERGDGRMLSMDAIEAILVGLLAPVSDIRVGRSEAAAGMLTPQLGLHVGQTCLPVTGTRPALDALEQAFASRVDQHVAAPLSYLKDAHLQRLAVGMESLVGLVTLDEGERANLEPGGGVVLDAVWPQGLTVAGRKFVADHGEWRMEPGLANGALRVLAGRTERTLDDPRLDAPLEPGTTLELVEGETTIATGHLASIQPGNQGPRLILALDPLT